MKTLKLGRLRKKKYLKKEENDLIPPLLEINLEFPRKK